MPPFITNIWHVDDDERLVTMWLSGQSIPEICQTLARSDGAIKDRLTLLRKRGYELPYRKTYKPVGKIKDASMDSLRIADGDPLLARLREHPGG